MRVTMREVVAARQSVPVPTFITIAAIQSDFLECDLLLPSALLLRA